MSKFFKEARVGRLMKARRASRIARQATSRKGAVRGAVRGERASIEQVFMQTVNNNPAQMGELRKGIALARQTRVMGRTGTIRGNVPTMSRPSPNVLTPRNYMRPDPNVLEQSMINSGKIGKPNVDIGKNFKPSRQPAAENVAYTRRELDKATRRAQMPTLKTPYLEPAKQTAKDIKREGGKALGEAKQTIKNVANTPELKAGLSVLPGQAADVALGGLNKGFDLGVKGTRGFGRGIKRGAKYTAIGGGGLYAFNRLTD